MKHSKSKPATILVVEDDPALSTAYKLILETVGHKVITADNGKLALSELKTLRPDVILLDMHMPVMNGIDFLKQYKLLRPDGVKVVVFSNYDASDQIDSAYSLGADRYVLKARAAPKELLHLIDSVLDELAENK